MHSIYKIFIPIILIALSIQSCNNDDDVATVAIDNEPYINLLISKDVNGSQQFSVLNKNGSQDLETLPDMLTKGLTIVDNQNYVTGHYKNAGLWNGVYWNNGTAIPLPNTGNTVFTEDITVKQGNTYIAGREVIDGVGIKARLWENGAAINLSTPNSINSFAQAVAVNNGDTYVCGRVRPALGGNDKAVVWKNNIIIELSSSPNKTYANDILIDGADYYTAGYENTLSSWDGKVWKNNTELITINNPNKSIILYSLDMYEGDVYTIGTAILQDGSSTKVIEYYKNDELLGSLAQSATRADGLKIKVINGAIYCLGVYVNDQQEFVTSVWKNGVVQDKSSLDSTDFILDFDF